MLIFLYIEYIIVGTYADTKGFKVIITFQKLAKQMLGIIANLFVKCMEQVIKGHLYHLLG